MIDPELKSYLNSIDQRLQAIQYKKDGLWRAFFRGIVGAFGFAAFPRIPFKDELAIVWIKGIMYSYANFVCDPNTVYVADAVFKIVYT